MELNFTTFTNIIDGKPTTTAETRYSINPSTKAPNPPVPVSTKQDLDDAVNAARRALKGWAATPWDERRDALLSFVKAVVGRKEEFAGMLVREQGKPVVMNLFQFDLGFFVNFGVSGSICLHYWRWRGWRGRYRDWRLLNLRTR